MKRIDANKLIAEFMGLENHFKNEGGTKVFIDGEENVQNWECYDTERGLLITPIEMQYHTSWDWLMPVISKCLEIGANASVERIYHALHTQDLSFAYKEVVEFIKEHKSKDFDWCNDSGFSDVFDSSLCECTAPQVNDGMCICGRPISNTELKQ